MDFFGTDTHGIPEVPSTAVITASQWAEITAAVAERLGKLEDKREVKRRVAMLVECGYDTIETLRTVVAWTRQQLRLRKAASLGSQQRSGGNQALQEGREGRQGAKELPADIAGPGERAGAQEL